MKSLPCWKSRFCHLGMLHGLPNLSISLAFAGLLYAIFRFFQDREREKQIRIQEHNEQIRKQEMYEMRQRFFIDISHELRTPLTLISSPLEEVMMRP